MRGVQKMSKKLNDVINEYCELSERIKADEKRLKELRSELLPLATVTKPFKTNRWCISYTVTEASVLDTKRIRDEMDTEWLKKYTTQSKREMLKVTKL
jgi:predicted phage-related endonuclease